MSLSVLDLVAERAKPRAGGLLPTIGGEALWGIAEQIVLDTAGDRVPGHRYVSQLAQALGVPLPRILVTAWRRYEEFEALAGAEGEEGGTGEVALARDEIEAHWEIAPRFQGVERDAPRLLVDLKVELEGVSVVVTKGSVMGIRSGRLRYTVDVRIKGAPKALAAIGPKEYPVGDLLLDFGEGFPLRR